MRALWECTGPPEEGASSTRVSALEFHDHMTTKLQKGPLLSLKKIRLEDLGSPLEVRLSNSQCTDFFFPKHLGQCPVPNKVLSQQRTSGMTNVMTHVLTCPHPKPRQASLINHSILANSVPVWLENLSQCSDLDSCYQAQNVLCIKSSSTTTIIIITSSSWVLTVY